MTDTELLERIVIAPEVMAGKPVIKGTRLTVDFILNQMAHGATEQDVIKEYDGLTMADIQACLRFSARSMQNTEFMPLAANG